jgi:hypothetical protein
VEAAASAINPPEPERCSRFDWPAPAASTGGWTRGSPARCAERKGSAVLAFVTTAVAEECEGHRQDWGQGAEVPWEVGHELQQLRVAGHAQMGVGNSAAAVANSPSRFMPNRATTQLRRARRLFTYSILVTPIARVKHRMFRRSVNIPGAGPRNRRSLTTSVRRARHGRVTERAESTCGLPRGFVR